MMFLRKAISVFLALIVTTTMFCISFAVNADSSHVRNRKIVSLVFDDSGSMEGEKWEYTNYAVQCFAAMLNAGDKFDITYLNNGSVSIDTTNRKQAVETIRKRPAPSGGTPVEAIKTAFDKMVAANDKNPNTEYWLVVMTDGDMSSGLEDVQRRIDEHADAVMPNGTKARIVFMTICDLTGAYTPHSSKPNVQIETAKTAKEVLNVISKIACNISGRYEVKSSDVKFINSRTVKISSDLPLMRLGVLVQGSSAKIESIEGAEEPHPQLEYNVSVELPMKSNVLSAEEKAMLHGNISLFSLQGKNIPAGSYTIYFSEDIKKEDIVVMLEPAFELRLEFYIDGTKVDDPSNLMAGQKVDIEAVLYETGTDNRILHSMLPSGAEMLLTVSEGGKTVKTEKILELKGYELKHVDTLIEAELKIPGYFTVRDVADFTPEETKISGLSAELYYDGSPRLESKDGTVDEENVVYVTDIENNRTGVRFILYIDGVPINKDKALALKERFIKGLEVDFDNYEVAVEDDGTILVHPTKKSWLIPDFVYWLQHRGDSEISVTLDSNTASETICFKLGDLKAAVLNLINYIIAIYLVLTTFAFFFKPHFSKGRIKVQRSGGEDVPYQNKFDMCRKTGIGYGTDALRTWLFIWHRPKKKIGHFKIQAESGGGCSLLKVKDMPVSRTRKYPRTPADKCKEKNFEFISDFYIRDGASYYHISINNV